MTMDDSPLPNGRQAARPTTDDIFGPSEPIQNAKDLGCDGIFDDGEVEESLADLYAMRRSDVA